jgi:hypothetical protein
MLVDIGARTVINSVSPDDSVSNIDGSFGLDPTEENCGNISTIASLERFCLNRSRMFALHGLF